MTIRCPRCRSEDNFRLRRKRWMRLIPFTHRYRCDDCTLEYLCSFGVVVYRQNLLTVGLIVVLIATAEIALLGWDGLAEWMVNVQAFAKGLR